MIVIAEEKYSPQRVRLLLPMHRLRHPKLTEEKNLTKELTECFLNGLPECSLKVFKGLTEYFSRGEIYQRDDRRRPLHCNALETLRRSVSIFQLTFI